MTVDLGAEIYYIGWVAEGVLTPPDNLLQWNSKVLTIKGSDIHYSQYPPVKTYIIIVFIRTYLLRAN